VDGRAVAPGEDEEVRRPERPRQAASGERRPGNRTRPARATQTEQHGGAAAPCTSTGMEPTEPTNTGLADVAKDRERPAVNTRIAARNCWNQQESGRISERGTTAEAVVAVVAARAPDGQDHRR